MTGAASQGPQRALADGPLGVQFGGHVGAADQVRLDARRAQRLVQVAARLLAGAQDHRVGGHEALLAVDRDVQALVVDPVVRGPGDGDDPAVLELRAVDPAGGGAEAGADLGGLALEQVDRRGGAGRSGAVSPPGPVYAVSTPQCRK